MKTLNEIQSAKLLVGKNFIAQKGIEKFKISYSYNFRGAGINAFIKAGDVIKVIDQYTNIGEPVCATDKVLSVLTTATFLNKEYFIQLD